jgi:hypothetical protein
MGDAKSFPINAFQIVPAQSLAWGESDGVNDAVKTLPVLSQIVETLRNVLIT